MRDGSGRYGRVLLLGGSSEIGLSILNALEFIPGADVLLAGRDPEALQALPLPAAVRRHCLRWDATESPVDLLAQALEGGDLDLVIAAAGVLGSGAESDVLLAHTAVMTNLVGLIDVLVPLAEALRVQQHGTIVVLSSVAGMRARKSNYVYGASKAGLDSFASGLADRLHPYGVRVLLVRPGFVTGRMTNGLVAAPFATTPYAVGAAVRKALDADRAVVWVPQVLKFVVPVLRVTPRFLWRRMSG